MVKDLPKTQGSNCFLKLVSKCSNVKVVGENRTETASKLDYFVFDTCLSIIYGQKTDDFCIELHDDAVVVHEQTDQIDLKIADILERNTNVLGYHEFKKG